MMRQAAFIVCATLALCCVAQADEALLRPQTASRSHQSDAIGITFEVTSWGHTVERWSLDSAGRASLVLRPRHVDLRESIEPRTFTVSSTDFERVRAALAPAERLAGRHLSCGAPTDQPYGQVTWARPGGAVKSVSWWYGECSRPNADMNFLLERLREADRLLHDIRTSKWLARLPGDVVHIEDDEIE